MVTRRHRRPPTLRTSSSITQHNDPQNTSDASSNISSAATNNRNVYSRRCTSANQLCNNYRRATGSNTEVIATTSMNSRLLEEDVNVHLLKLKTGKSVKWKTGTVDNENMKKKSSKSCCIFHKRRQFGESSTESSCAENSDSDHETDKRRTRRKSKKGGACKRSGSDFSSCGSTG